MVPRADSAALRRPEEPSVILVHKEIIMGVARVLPTLGLLLLAASSLLGDPTATKSRAPAKDKLTPATFAKFQAMIRPQAHEWRHLRVRWLTDIVAARKKAAAEDKPLIVLRTGGAGYNDPLGAC
jgi:hypothetical protein